MHPTQQDVEWLLELAARDEPPAVAIDALVHRGLASGSDLELWLLQQKGCRAQKDTRDGSLWVNADEFVAASFVVAGILGPKESPPSVN